MTLQGLGHTPLFILVQCMFSVCVCVLCFNVARLLATITPLLRSMCSSGILWCLVLLVLATLAICVGYMCVWWCLTGTWSYVLAICLCVRCLCLVLAALWLYVKSGSWRAPDARGEWPL